MKKLLLGLILVCSFITKTIAQTTPFNWENATVYFLITDRFNNGSTANDLSYGRTADPVGGFLGGDIAGLTQKINDNYFTDLGINAIWITAPYEQIHGAVPGYWGPSGYPSNQHYAYHGYYPLDWTEMDANMGTRAEFQTMVDAAHAKGIRILMDIVLNHTGYETVLDSQQLNFGTLGDPWSVPNTGLDVNNASWCNWWVDNSGVSWVRKGDTATDYCSPACGGGDKPMCLAGLPDVRTEMTTNVGLPKVLQTKWDAAKETQEQNELTAFWAANPTYPQNPANYIVKWLTDWVREFGIDGFRIDTYKHVETEVWGRLKDQAQIAFDDWKTANPTKKLDNTPFWMVGELYGAGITRNTDAITNGKTDATINFNFQTANLATSNLESIYSSYATAFAPADWTTMSYISSHDTYLYNRSNLIQAGSALLMCPGPVQIFYGDETARPIGTTGSDQDSRTVMNWSSINTSVQAHWQKLGKFRAKHLSIGAGSHTMISASPYTFKRAYQPAVGCEDQVVVVMGASGSTTVNVSSVFADGTLLKDYYTNTTATVSGGNVTFTAHSNGVILIENPNPVCGPSLVLTPTPTQTSTTLYYDATSVSVAISATSNNGANDVNIYYTTNGTTPTPSSTLYSTALNFTNPTNLTLKAIACEAGNTICSSVKSVHVIAGTLPGFKVYFKNPTAWGTVTPRVYWWNATPTGNLPNATGFGNLMTPLTNSGCTGWSEYTFSNITSTNLLFNRSAWGAGNQTADQMNINATGWFDGTTNTWSSMPPVSCTPCTPPSEIPSISPTSVTINLGQSTSLSASGCGAGQSLLWSNGATTSSISVSPTVTTSYSAQCVSATGCAGTISASGMVNVMQPPSSGMTVYFQKPSAWSNNIKIHFWNPTPAGSVTPTTWPGESMIDEGGGWFKYIFSSAVKSINLIFNDNGSGTSKTNDLFTDKTAYFPTGCLTGGPIGNNGIWTSTDPRTATAGDFDVFFENTANWTQPKIYYWNLDPLTGGPAPNAWSGNNMTLVSGNVWKYSFTGLKSVCLIFNNGSSSQSANLTTINSGGTFNFAQAKWTCTAADISLNSDINSGTVKHETNGAINANNKVIGTSVNVKFDAKKSINLNPGFEAQSSGNTVFQVLIDGCGNN
jgi:alpha-amylase